MGEGDEDDVFGWPCLAFLAVFAAGFAAGAVLLGGR